MITAQLIKELRDRTGVGMSKCKEALEEAKGNIDLAIDNLRKSGMASAVKKEGRAANDGLIGFAESKTHLALVEINSETDFVAKNDKFKAFLDSIANEILHTAPKNLESFLGQKFSKDLSLSIDEYRSTIIQVLGENIVIKTIELLHKKPGHSYGIYSHMQGKIVTVVELDKPHQEHLAKEIGMHVAAEAPEYLNPSDIPAHVIAHEKEIAAAQIKDKPQNIVEKIAEGKIQAYVDQVCLNRQKYVKDNKLTVAQFLDAQLKGLHVTKFIRWQIGN